MSAPQPAGAYDSHAVLDAIRDHAQEMPAAADVPTLVVAEWRSRCSTCGRDSLIDLTHSIVPSPALVSIPGCGVRYQAVADEQDARGSAEWVAEDLDLPHAGRRPWPVPQEVTS